ncbi:TPA: hypothetical protein ACYFMJ_003443 [Klebsiella pneumoniae]|uniref:hypothetical protein n=1 Tax=Klebsiella TaxID=570 RepID=UPI0019A14B9E|nr:MULTISPECIES: hypothetical protein [Klebsiella]EIX9464442.1 hypothetical protein [Klebsiella pneumoniae]MBD0877782.1 hypothetical protein [Klebsiella pneumoniae]MBD0881347.1 hypothetical protein [Klebsiella pneumoniae]MBD0888223.1 hypothetical protein [Klebsiella pneumoniae]MBD0895510.1 hypothetical protein [Klebsiella pneumoniae]
MTDITELTSVQKNANIHRLSRLIAYAPNYELRQMAVEVEHYTDRLIDALENAQRANNSAPAILRQLAEEKQKRGEVAAATAFNYAASALQMELSK